MNKDNCELACGLVSRSYISQGQQALAKRQKQVKALLSSRRCAHTLRGRGDGRGCCHLGGGSGLWGRASLCVSKPRFVSAGCRSKAGTKLQ